MGKERVKNIWIKIPFHLRRCMQVKWRPVDKKTFQFTLYGMWRSISLVKICWYPMVISSAHGCQFPTHQLSPYEASIWIWCCQHWMTAIFYLLMYRTLIWMKISRRRYTFRLVRNLAQVGSRPLLFSVPSMFLRGMVLNVHPSWYPWCNILDLTPCRSDLDIWMIPDVHKVTKVASKAGCRPTRYEEGR